MITNRPAIDWLTLTTFSAVESRRMSAWIDDNYTGETKETGWKQYKGTGGEGFLLGSAMQNGKTHYMLRLSGDLSDKFMFDKSRPHLDCNRLDLQVTIAWPYSPVETYEQFKDFTDVMGSRPKDNQRQRKVNTILSPDGFCTAYIGSRQSERFYRLYVKEDDKLYLRFEAEFKGKAALAGSVYRKIGKMPEMAVNIAKAEVYTLPSHELTAPFIELLRGVPSEIMANGRQRSDPHKTLRWITRQCLPAFKRVLAYDDTRDRAGMILGDLVEFAESLGIERHGLD